MPTSSQLLTPDARRSANRLLVQGERTADLAAATAPYVLETCEVEVRPALIEQAKGALMLRPWPRTPPNGTGRDRAHETPRSR
jgi:hypothetical protein